MLSVTATLPRRNANDGNFDRGGGGNLAIDINRVRGERVGPAHDITQGQAVGRGFIGPEQAVSRPKRNIRQAIRVGGVRIQSNGGRRCFVSVCVAWQHPL